MDLRGLTDKELIVFLVACGLEIKDIEKERSKNHSTVYFENSEMLRQSELEYVNRSKSVNMADFMAAEKRVRTLLYAQKN